MTWDELRKEDHDGEIAKVTIDGVEYTGMLLWMSTRTGGPDKVRLWSGSTGGAHANVPPRTIAWSSVAPATDYIASKSTVELLPLRVEP